MEELPAREISRLKFQRAVGWATFPLVGLGSVVTMRLIRNNRVEGVAEARRTYLDALQSGRPVLICANHLTMVDSAFLHWALAPLWTYLWHYRRFSWNVAAFEHLTGKPYLRPIVYLAKTVPIDRSGDAEHRKAVFSKMRWLVANGEVLTLFPEGTRSRTGRIDPSTISYGAGQLLVGLERPLVLCAYLRGRRQEAMSALPAWGDVLDLKLEVLEPSTAETGLRATRDLSRQIAAKLKAMEDAWFAQRGLAAVADP